MSTGPDELHAKPAALDKLVPDAWAAAQKSAAAISESVRACGLTPAEAELIKVRASQLNGCAFCLDLHSRQARQAGVAQQKLDLLPAWRESDVFTDDEQAVLAVAEAVTELPRTDDREADLVAARALLGDERFVAAEWVAVSINAFNRISIQRPSRTAARRLRKGDPCLTASVFPTVSRSSTDPTRAAMSSSTTTPRTA